MYRSNDEKDDESETKHSLEWMLKLTSNHKIKNEKVSNSLSFFYVYIKLINFINQVKDVQVLVYFFILNSLMVKSCCYHVIFLCNLQLFIISFSDL